jgi:Holliday junction resolvase
VPNRNKQHGTAFERRVMIRFSKAGWPYVKRHYSSIGIADIICVKSHLYETDINKYFVAPICVLIQCKFSRQNPNYTLSKVDRKALIEFAGKCAAIPIYAYSRNRKMHLIDLRKDREFDPYQVNKELI